MNDNDQNVAAALERIEGRLNVLAATVEAGDRASAQAIEASNRHSAQLVELLRQQNTYLAADVGVAKAELVEHRKSTDAGLTRVRMDVTEALRLHRVEQFEPLKARVDMMDRQWARASGIALGAGLLGSGGMFGLLKAMGAT